MRRPSLVLAILACFSALSLATPSAGAATDLRIQLNPLLAELHAKDPARAEAAVDALNRIIQGQEPTPPGTRAIDNPRERELIEGNPLFEEAWRIDPKAALEQLREIVAAGGGS